MRLDFLDRDRELRRLEAALGRRQGALLCVYGRRRLGKSRLLYELVRRRRAVYYVGDDRDAALQRAALAREISEMLPGFADVPYPDWEPLLARWWHDAPAGADLVLDEFPAMVATSAHLPSVLQKLVDRFAKKRVNTVLCGSSQRMMQGLLLDPSTPLYGRAREIVKLEPLGLRWLRRAFGGCSAALAIEHYAAWGGVPRYWELALDYENRMVALANLVLDPMGVLHREPERLLLDESRDIARAASILALIGQGCHRTSEIGARLAKPSTSLARPLARLIDLGLIAREVPFGRSTRDTKRTHYRIRDPFLRFWYRFVEPNRSRLAAGQVPAVARYVERSWSQYLGSTWEELARQSVASLEIAEATWSPAGRWWGPGTDRAPLEIDIAAQAVDDPGHLLLGEVKLTASAKEARSALAALRAKAARCPLTRGRRVSHALWVLQPRGRIRGLPVVTANQVVEGSG